MLMRLLCSVCKKRMSNNGVCAKCRFKEVKKAEARSPYKGTEFNINDLAPYKKKG